MSRKLEIGELFADKYRILELIGQGGYGAVYRACQENIPRDVALKIMLPESSDDNQIKRFRREAQHISQLKHPNTITLFDFGYDEQNSIYYIVMELLEGNNLAHIIDNHGALDLARAHRVCSQVLRSLNEAHARGLVHRDLKPENVFLVDMPGEVDFVKVLDFGIARGKEEKEERLTVKGTVVGTPWYMAPEQALGREVTTGTDVYAVGLLLYEMLTGRQAFQGDTAYAVLNKHVTEPIADLPDGLAQTPYNALIAKACAKKPVDRFPNAEAFLRELVQHDPYAIQKAASSFVPPVQKPPVRPETLVGPGHAKAIFAPTVDGPIPTPPSPPSASLEPDPAATIMAPVIAPPSERDPAATIAAPVAQPSPRPPPAALKRWGAVSAEGSDATMVVDQVSERSPQRVPSGPPPFVARHDELHTLQSLVDYVLETRALHMVLVDGEIGVGKTRLWEELSASFDTNDDAPTFLKCAHHTTTPPLHALREIMFAITSPKLDSDEEILVLADQLVYQHSTGVLGTFLSAFFNKDAPMPRAETLDLKAVQALWAIFEQLLRAATKLSPLILCFDDMQWTDELTAYFIQHLAERMRLENAPIGVVMMIRPGVIFGNPDATEALLHASRLIGDRFFNLHLARLAPADFRAFVKGIVAVDDATVDALWSFTLGNPWVAFETLSFASHSGALQWSGEQWTTTETSLKVPPALLARAEQALEPLIPPQQDHALIFWCVLQWIAVLDQHATHTTVRTGIRRDPRGPDIRMLEEMLEALVHVGAIKADDQGREKCFELTPPLLRAVVLTLLEDEPHHGEVHEFAKHLRGR